MAVVNTEQAEYWNGAQSAQWVQEQRRHDEMLEQVVAPLLDAADLVAGDRVLDIGCGCGATTRAAASRVGSGGRALGADLSVPMLERARELTRDAGLTTVDFVEADAQVHDFTNGGGRETVSFDAVISRFGVMFFADPVAAFANIRRACREGARLAFACWQAMAANDWFLLPAATLAPFATDPAPPAPPPGAPGPFAFAEPDRAPRILADAGWGEIAVEPHQFPLVLGGPGSLDDAVDFVANARFGKSLLAGLDATGRAEAINALREALRPFETEDGVRMTGAIWIVTARA